MGPAHLKDGLFFSFFPSCLFMAPKASSKSRSSVAKSAPRREDSSDVEIVAESVKVSPRASRTKASSPVKVSKR